MNENQTAQALAYLSPDVCFIMDDDSMEGAGILAGDIVAFTACDHAENGQIVAIQTDSTVLLFRAIKNGRFFITCPTGDAIPCLYSLSELPGAKIIGKAVEVLHVLNPAGESVIPQAENEKEG
jgi:SOS-response transcriptional repressor LexA